MFLFFLIILFLLRWYSLTCFKETFQLFKSSVTVLIKPHLNLVSGVNDVR